MGNETPIRIVLNLKDAFEWQMKLPQFLEYQLSIRDLQVSYQKSPLGQLQVGIKGFSKLAAEEIEDFLTSRFHGAVIMANCVDHWMDKFSAEKVPAFKVVRQPT